MIAGGTNILTNPDFTAGLDRGRFLSRTGGCKTFDDEADGYCRGEDGDPIKGVILNVLTNHSAEAESITRPSLHAQREIFTSPLHVSYVEMHGTGTQVTAAASPAWLEDKTAEAQANMGSLKRGLESGACYRFTSNMVYRIGGRSGRI
ncbi:hypothetical protein M406DRAFT_74138 [Cryphonectria parasitica EP155]|uniref:Ketosynthase family 3 (KS3) domain-containing protein n=1 Tax=Cryphonectria parasitica (strain ATCC 38755 / EP155) TaxID=660469 RepID=A0A9P4XZ30_CRYP1|nr:uncharacterized protein M406DRAFT_74138 [Cryphonectria parasitica EP155]KAF3763546.1 hypothetical protein M406DRAFT_74138 [Cryphonectria parasitica EP155]